MSVTYLIECSYAGETTIHSAFNIDSDRDKALKALKAPQRAIGRISRRVYSASKFEHPNR
jgi:hypothetical protein